MAPEQVDNFQSLADLISERTGLRLREEDRESWLKTIKARLKSSKLSAEKYRQFLIPDSPDSRHEWNALATLLTTGETYFFRDKGQFSLIRNWMLPELIERQRHKKQLRIWSAGCSTGEELYSMAILIDELRTTNYELRDWDILIIGTDINANAIEKAKKGIYSQWSFRMVDPDLQGRYFHRRKDEWELDSKIKEMVMFKTGNIVQDLFPDHASGIYDMDIIFCRNVFIYFNDDAVYVALKKITDTLSERGYIIAGHGELHGRKLERLKPMIFPESVVYQKIAGNRMSLRGEAEASLKTGKNAIVKDGITTPFRLAMTEKEAESKIERPDTQSSIAEFQPLIDAAESYADTGEYDKAASACGKAIALDSTAVKPYFLLAHVVEAKGNIEEAKSLMKKAIYLDPAFIPAYLELGSLYDNEGDTERAKKMRSAALELLRTLPSDENIGPYQGITAGELARYVEKLTGVEEAKV